MKPTVGRIVHYINLGDKDGRYPPEQQAAIITGVYPRANGRVTNEPIGIDINGNCMSVDLHIFYRTGDFLMTAVPFSAEYKRGHWSWPEKIEG